MLYAKVIDGQVVEYPLTLAAIKAALAATTSFGTGSFVPPAPYVEVDEVAPDLQWDDTAVELPLVFENDRWHQAWDVGRATQVVVDARLEAAKTAKRAALADYRWQREVAGMSFMGVPLATDAISQTKYIGAVIAAQIDPQVTIRWKAASGAFLTLDAATIIGVAQAVRAHVQSCFNRESDLVDLINSQTTVPAIEAVDITQGWPS
jgi:Domain of unknown function (DUF4376)